MARVQYPKPSQDELARRLSPLEFEVTQRAATEPPFRNRYWDHHEEGIYVDVVTGEPLFSSTDKFDSGTGWPSFSAPLEPNRVIERKDSSHAMVRTEVRSASGDSHLGHLFNDGPPSTGLRYCINSAALRFVPRDRLVEEGYGQHLALFQERAAKSTIVAEDNVCRSDQSSAQGCRSTFEEAYLAGGCFWGMQDILRKVPGVIDTKVGYIGGTSERPTYEDVKTSTTGHAETVYVAFDPQKLSFEELLEKWFFRMHDPTTKDRQGNDRGSQYRSAIFYLSEAQRQGAERVIARVAASGRWSSPIVTEVVPALKFTLAEDYHQDYLVKHPGGYTCHFLRD